MKTLQYLGTIGQVLMIISVITLKFKPAFQLDCYFYKSVSTEKAPLSLSPKALENKYLQHSRNTMLYR